MICNFVLPFHNYPQCILKLTLLDTEGATHIFRTFRESLKK